MRQAVLTVSFDARAFQFGLFSGLGALLSFDQHNIRYTTSTVIGEWARDPRFA